jgi:hypothetical protein
MKRLILVFAAVYIPGRLMAWDGYDYDSSNYVEIEKGNLVRPGQEVEYFDYGAGEYRDGDVESIRGSGSSVEVEVYDRETGEYRTFEMDR